MERFLVCYSLVAFDQKCAQNFSRLFSNFKFEINYYIFFLIIKSWQGGGKEGAGSHGFRKFYLSFRKFHWHPQASLAPSTFEVCTGQSRGPENGRWFFQLVGPADERRFSNGLDWTGPAKGKWVFQRAGRKKGRRIILRAGPHYRKGTRGMCPGPSH